MSDVVCTRGFTEAEHWQDGRYSCPGVEPECWCPDAAPHQYRPVMPGCPTHASAPPVTDTEAGRDA